MVEPGSGGSIAEIDLCRAWTRLPRSVPLQTTDGHLVDVIHLGTWTHGFGPDFRGAIISIDNGVAQHGSIELHLRTRGWTDHRHHLDPRYNDVVLHVVGRSDPVETRRADGKLVPTVVLDIQALALPTHEVDWSLVGGAVCAEQLARDQPNLIRDIVGKLGDQRMTARSARIESRLIAMPPDAVLYGEILDALGYSSNREPMAAIADRLPWSVALSLSDRADDRFSRLCAAFLGTAGFLPLSDVERSLTGLEIGITQGLAADWLAISKDWRITAIPATSWALARIRPSNHPIRRLVQAAAILAETTHGLGPQVLAQLRAGQDPTNLLIERVATAGAPSLGNDRARAITTNVLIPFAFALAGQNGDADLTDGVARVWESMPGAESNERTRRAIHQVAGEIGLKRLGARQQQGLIHLDQTLCMSRRCFECPIAAVVVREAAPRNPRLG